MNDSFTILNELSTSDYPSLDDIDDAFDYLTDPDSFRTFKEGLTELLEKKGYSGKTNDIKALSEFLISRLQKINSPIGKATVISWFDRKHSPKVEPGSRSKIYEICFALELSYEETLWFFQHVYYDRAFNCHTIDEAVYYYAFLKHLTYPEAQSIIQEVKDAPTLSTATDASENYTQIVKNRIDYFESVTELKTFLIQNKGDFSTWNKSALVLLNNLKSKLLGPPESKTAINNLKRIIKQNSHSDIQLLNLFDSSDYQNCGLLMKEILFDFKEHSAYESPAEYFGDTIGRKNIFSNDFILACLLSNPAGGMPKNKEIKIPDIVRSNFPSKKTMSDILSEKDEKKNKILVSKSYDSIRKMIVLLFFYCFWLEVKLGIGGTKNHSNDELPGIYIEQSDARLLECGYEEMYQGNPYDWIFLCSAKSEDPLKYFKDIISKLLGESDDI